ncbi:MAG: alpha-2-macroglobulin family protein, partial [Chitinophagia bacterium]|nr:alpha-2-macroglobulin family protein [Chitinophagia bacterium]
QRVVFTVNALPAIGTGKVVVAVKALGETFTNETEMSVRPTASLQKIYTAGSIAGGSTATIPLTNDFMPGTGRGKIVVAASPLVQFTKNLSNLVNYPYGCVEQTTSAVFPQLYYPDLLKSLSGTTTTDPNINNNIQVAIAKLQAMQMSNGALSYWPSGGRESWWGSVYATHFLLEARRNGFEVNQHTLDRLQLYLKGKLAKKETEILYYNQHLRKEIAPKEVPYSLYILAMAGQPDLSSMNYYKAHSDMLAIDGKYLLAAAFAKAGMPDKARQVLPPAFAGEVSEPSASGSFYSYTRDLGLALYALMDIDPNSQQVGTLARMLSAELNKQTYLSTQENVFGILAMGRLARNANAGNATAEVLVNNKTMATTKGAATTVNLADAGNGNVQVRVKGTGTYYYFTELSGISATGAIKLEDSYLKVRRTFYTRDGQPVSGNTFRQSQLLVVKISIVSTLAAIDNVAITDMLPAGFEIENSRLNALPATKWIMDAAEADYTDIRDDRINIFTTAETKVKHFYYMVRAVSPGVYQLGPVQADAMYVGAWHSYSGGGTITVTE